MARILQVKEPTGQQCNDQEKVFEDDLGVGYAIWYPQMGGYVGKAVVVVNKSKPDGCFDVYVWHDGEFPFGGRVPNEYYEDGRPRHLHHCVPQQFIHFGQAVIRMAKQVERTTDG